jgi:PAS domain S-box-containing protein
MAWLKKLKDWIWRRQNPLAKSNRYGVVILILLLTFGEFCLDCATPLGLMDWLWYFAPLILTLQLGSRRFPYVLTAFISVLIFVGYHFSPPGSNPHLSFVGRCIGLSVMWVVALLISDQVRFEQKLLNEGRLNAAVLADQLDAVCRLAADGTFLYVNDFFCYFFGKKREELIGHKWQPIALPEDVPMIETRLRELSQANPIVIIENRVRNRDGEMRWMQFVNRAIFDAAGQMVELQAAGRDVTDRRRVEESLRESEQRFRQLAENIQEIFWLFDVAQNQIVYISPHYEKHWGRSCAALYADPYDWTKAIHPEDRERVLAAVMKQPDEVYYEEYRIVMPDGEVRWTRGRAFPIHDDSGRTIRIAGLHEDITRRKQLSEAYQRSQENYRNLAESSPDAIFILDMQLKVRYINRAGARMVGKFPAEMEGCAFSEFFPAEFASEYQKSLRTVFESGRPLTRERKTMMQGVERWVETRVLPLHNQRGEVTAVMGISRDMTEQRKAEHALRQREELSRELIDGMREGFFRVDYQGKIRDVNAAYCRMSGYSREELLTMEVHQLSLTDVSQKQVQQRIARSLQTGDEQFETRHRRKDGSILHLETLITHLEMEGQHILALMRDISERKQLEQEVLKITLHERQRIGYDLHDGLGQHLAGVAFKAKVLEESLTAAKSPDCSQAQEIVSLVNQAITQTRVLARSLSPVEVEVNGLIAALEHLASETRRSYSVDCHLHCVLQNFRFGPQVSTTFYRIAQESIHNAMRHGGAELVEMEIGREADGRLFLRVRDNGKGFIPEAKMTTGMGLRIMKYRVNSIGGALNITSAPGKGTEIVCLVSAENASL